MRILVSACLLGVGCRYDGNRHANPAIVALLQAYDWVPVCPEQMGGLPTPRPPAEIRDGRVVTSDGQDVTEAFLRGAEETRMLARRLGCAAAVLKARSPSCGTGRIYDGSFSGKLVVGDGVTARALLEDGMLVADETNFLEMFHNIP